MAIRWIVEWMYGRVYECVWSVLHTFFLFVRFITVFGLYLTMPYLRLCSVDGKPVREWWIGNHLTVTDRDLINVLYRNSAGRIEWNHGKPPDISYLGSDSYRTPAGVYVQHIADDVTCSKLFSPLHLLYVERVCSNCLADVVRWREKNKTSC